MVINTKFWFYLDGQNAWIEAHLNFQEYDDQPILRTKINLTKHTHCDNHYVVLRSESLTAKTPGQHPGISLHTAGMGDVGGTYANTGQVSYCMRRQ